MQAFYSGLVSAQTAFYVSPSGSDSNPGTEAQPFRTLEKARDTIRTINGNMQNNITVYLRGGTYTLVTPFTLTTSDSGTNGYYVVYRNYPGEKPVISGGMQVTGWVQEGDKWKAYVGSMDTRQLYVNGVRMTRARSAGGLPGGQKTATGYTTTDLSMQSWRNLQDIEMVSQTLWKLYRCGVQSISGSSIIMKQPCWDYSQLHSGFTMGLPDWIENAYELLDSPGEWYLDKPTGWIYYKPYPQENFNDDVITIPVLESLVIGTGTTLDNPIHNIMFEGLTFSYATWLRPNTNEGFPELESNVLIASLSWDAFITPANVRFIAAKSIIFQGNTFSHLGAAGLSLEYGSQNNVVNGNHFFDVSGNGLTAGNLEPHPADPRTIIGSNQITNNYIHGIGAEYMGAAGIFLAYTQNTLVAQNELADLPWSGIENGWGWGAQDPTIAMNNLFQNNLIRDHVKTMNDGGGIRNIAAQPGTRITGNVIKGQTHEYGALYIDDASRYIEADNNVIVNNVRTAMVKGGENHIHDNWWTNAASIWFLNPMFGPNIVENNHEISSEAEAPVSITQNAGLQAAYRYMKDLPPPGNLRHVCYPAGSNVIVFWDSAEGATSYLLRIDDTTNNGPEAADGWYVQGSNDLMIEVPGAIKSYTYAIYPNRQYAWWIHSKDGAGYGANPISSFTCPVVSNGAQFVSQTVPTSVSPGQQFQASITMRNSGTSTWTKSFQYNLGWNYQLADPWSIGRVRLGDSETISPGQAKAFSFQVTAPSSPGIYNFQWLMVQDYVEWFGDYTPNVQISVAACPDADSDGYTSSSCGGMDCNDAVQGIHPGAPDACNNGIDEDCSGADAQCHTSDINHDGCISQSELTAFITRWYVSSTDVTIKELMEAIGLWKTGGC